MTSNFDRSIAFVLKHEGGYINNSRDIGGETKYGISKRAYPTVDIKNLTEEQAKEIYLTDYWIKAECDKLEWPLCVIHFDTAVNMGVARAQSFLTLTTSWRLYLGFRLKQYTMIVDRNNRQDVFFVGWVNRVISLWRLAL